MELISAPQNLTSGWVNLGEPIDMTKASRLGLYIKLDINDSLNPRVRAMAKRGKNDIDLWELPIRTVGASDVKVEGEDFEFNVDADQNVVFSIATEGVVPFIQIQVQAGTVGASPGQIDDASFELSNY